MDHYMGGRDHVVGLLKDYDPFKPVRGRAAAVTHARQTRAAPFTASAQRPLSQWSLSTDSHDLSSRSTQCTTPTSSKRHSRGDSVQPQFASTPPSRIHFPELSAAYGYMAPTAPVPASVAMPARPLLSEPVTRPRRKSLSAAIVRAVTGRGSVDDTVPPLPTTLAQSTQRPSTAPTLSTIRPSRLPSPRPSTNGFFAAFRSRRGSGKSTKSRSRQSSLRDDQIVVGRPASAASRHTRAPSSPSTVRSRLSGQITSQSPALVHATWSTTTQPLRLTPKPTTVRSHLLEPVPLDMSARRPSADARAARSSTASKRPANSLRIQAPSYDAPIPRSVSTPVSAATIRPPRPVEPVTPVSARAPVPAQTDAEAKLWSAFRNPWELEAREPSPASWAHHRTTSEAPSLFPAQHSDSSSDDELESPPASARVATGSAIATLDEMRHTGFSDPWSVQRKPHLAPASLADMVSPLTVNDAPPNPFDHISGKRPSQSQALRRPSTYVVTSARKQSMPGAVIWSGSDNESVLDPEMTDSWLKRRPSNYSMPRSVSGSVSSFYNDYFDGAVPAPAMPRRKSVASSVKPQRPAYGKRNSSSEDRRGVRVSFDLGSPEQQFSTYAW